MGLKWLNFLKFLVSSDTGRPAFSNGAFYLNFLLKFREKSGFEIPIEQHGLCFVDVVILELAIVTSQLVLGLKSLIFLKTFD